MNFHQHRWILILVLAWLGVSFWTRREFLPYDVKSTDTGTFLFQAQTFAAGQLSRETPQPREFFQQWQVVVRNRSYAYYPPLHALLMSIPIRWGVAPWGVPWLLSGGSLLLFYSWCLRISSPTAALMGSLALAFSPFFAANSVSVLSHSSCLSLTLLFLWSIARRENEERISWALFSGIVLGLVFADRPLNAVALGLGWLPWLIRRQSMLRGTRVQSIVGFPLGGLCIVGLLFLYNHSISGRWTLELFTDYWPRNRWGFGHDIGRGEPGHYFQTYADHDWTGWLKNLAYTFNGLAHGWTGKSWVSLLLGLLLIVLLGHRLSRSKSFAFPSIFYFSLLIWPALHLVLYAFYFTPSRPVTGPRYAFEILPFLALATGWGLAQLRHVLSSRRNGRWGVVFLGACLIFFCIKSQADFYLENIREIPLRRQLEQTILREAHSPAMVFLRSFWIGHPFPIFLNPPDMKAPLLFACDRGEEDPRLVERYPDRNAYILAVTPLSREKADIQLIQFYDGGTRKWILDPGRIKAPFYVGSRFTPPLELRGETARKLFHPRREEIEPQ